MREVAVSGGSTVYVSKDRLTKLLSISLPLDVKGTGSWGGESNVPYFFFQSSAVSNCLFFGNISVMFMETTGCYDYQIYGFT